MEESRSVEMKTQSESTDIKIEVQIPEECLHSLMQIDRSPSIAIRRLVIGHRNHEEGIIIDPKSGQRDFYNPGYVGTYIYAHNMADSIPIADSSTRQVVQSPNHPAWNQDNFDKLILSLMESMETRKDIDELFSFLIAYGSEESNKPTAIQLKHRMSEQIAESNPELWNQHLRKCKARLTIAAKNLNLPKPFGKPYGKSPNRKHPIDEDLHHLLIPWIDGSNEQCLITLDGQFHEDSIEILKEFTPPEFVIG